MQKNKDFNPKSFKATAMKLPICCFKRAYQNAFFLSTEKDSGPFEKERFDLLDEIARVRGLQKTEKYKRLAIKEAKNRNLDINN